MTETIRKSMQSAARSKGIPYQDIPLGGGHDCAVFQGLGVPVRMIFIRNEHGSHNLNEHMEMVDFAQAADLLTGWARAEPFST